MLLSNRLIVGDLYCNAPILHWGIAPLQLHSETMDHLSCKGHFTLAAASESIGYLTCNGDSAVA